MEPELEPELEPGKALGGRYRLVAPLGHGGTSVVWQARDERLGREVAVKLLAPRLAGDAALARRLRTEARIAARLHHPHVVAVYDAGEFSPPDGQPVPYVVLELVEGRPLSEVLQDGPLLPADGLRVAAQVAAALAAAHARGIVHRDVKPENVILTDTGAKLVDFGISATIGEADLDPDGNLLCTPAYLAPERLRGGPVRAACDVYGLGLLLYTSLVGEPPWRRDELRELLTAHRWLPPPPLPPLPGLPAEVVELCLRCLAKRPADRPAIGEAARVLAAAAGTEAPDTSALPGTRPAPTRPLAVGHGTAPTVVTSATAASGWWSSDRRRRVFALAAAGMLLTGALAGHRLVADTGGPGAGGTGGTAAEVTCEVRYDLREDSGSAFAAEITLVNAGPAPVNGWRLDFAFPADQRVVSSTEGAWHQSGRSVAVEGSGARAALPAGQSVTLGFEGWYRDANPLPTAFQLNGTGCARVLTAAIGTEPGDRPGGSSQSTGGDRRGGPPAAGDDGDKGKGERGNGNGKGNGNGRSGG
jgi:serine/threonine-protein kinase